MSRTVLQALRRGFLENVRFARTAILAHKLRTFLTVLGIVIGVATVIAMVSMVEGFNRSVAQSFESFGATLVQFQRFDPQFGPGGGQRDEKQRLRKHLTYEDALAMRELCPSMRAVSPERYWFPSPRAGGQIPLATHRGREATPDTVGGVTEAYLDANAKQLALGRFVTEADERRAADVVVIGWSIADALFPFEDPLGKRITLAGRRYTVIGVLEEQGATGFESTDAHVLLPFSTFDRGFPWVARDFGVNIATVPKSPQLVDQVIEEGTNVLRQRRGLRFHQPNDFGIMTPDKLIGNFRAVTDGIAATMILIASIALLVGGVGVMNIMLVSVTERTREIGIRLAIGARSKDVMAQFLVESIVLSTLGGVVGLVLGVGGSLLAANKLKMPFEVSPGIMVLGFSFSVIIGVVFGYFPARKAARLNPIDALRHE